VEPYKKEVWIMGKLYDKRETEPIKDFKEMLSTNELNLNSVETYTMNQENDPVEMARLDISLDNSN
ncbi:MAG TPA: hypothetical protein DCS66_22840, partial [Flavobacteriaceae bacterium]|nr:hypothetical protein [Flavobacteriaceae bacterium]